jgi:hypothetical protein
MAVERDLQDDGVRVPETGTPPSDTGSTLRLAKGYPPVLGAMLLIDGLAALAVGGRASVSLGEVVVYVLLPPVAMVLVGLPGSGRRSRVLWLSAVGAAAAALFAALFLGGDVHLVTVPAWAAAAAGAALLAATWLLFGPRRQHVGRRRARLTRPLP